MVGVAIGFGGRAAAAPARAAAVRASTRWPPWRCACWPSPRRRLAHTSGFVAVYLCGLVLGNAALPHRAASIGFAEGMASLAQIGLFVLLGLLVVARPAGRARSGPALLIGGALLLVARPLSVLASLVLVPHAVVASRLFISWAGLRGAVPIVLATFPLDRAACPARRSIFDTVFVLVVVFTLVQGWSLPWVARRLRDRHPADPAGRRRRVGAAGRARRRPDAADGAGRLPAARRLPARAAAAGGRRGGARSSATAGPSCPTTTTRLMRGDQALLVAARRLAGRGRAAAAGGQPGRPAGQLARGGRARPTELD